MLAYLFCRGDREDHLVKAINSGADAVIADLEDGVAPCNKALARKSLENVAAQFATPEAPRLVLRCNPPGSVEFSSDLELARSLPLHALMIAKCEDPGDIAATRSLQCKIIPLIESAKGILRLEKILSADPRVSCAAFGSVDFAIDLGVDWTPGGIERLHALSHMVLVSRAIGCLPPIDGVFPLMKDPDALERDARVGASLGFGGKMLIHPEQIGPVRRAYVPAPERVEWANKVVQAWASSPNPEAIRVDNQMIDAPVAEVARRILLRAEDVGVNCHFDPINHDEGHEEE